MIVSVGTDLVDLARLEKACAARPQRFLDRILTAGERAYCDAKGDPLPSIGARFAAKEAVMKCLGTGWTRGVGWHDVEVVSDEAGAPGIRLHGVAREIAARLNIRRIHVSLSHTAGHALAMAVAED